MKIKAALLAFALIGGIQAFPASANVKPIVESFAFTPDDLDLSGKSTRVDFELVVSHPSGIDNTKTDITLKNSRNDTLTTALTRTDSPIDPKKTKVTFKGFIEFPRDLATGVYSVTATEIKNNSSAGYQYSTGTIESSKIRDLIGAESGILIRSFGDLNLDYATFVGPSYDATLGIAYADPIKFNSAKQPIWKVGEALNPSDYFELKVPKLPLLISTSTPKVCTSDGKIMSFVSEGTCSFIVSTAKTSDYKAKTYSQSATISAARVKVTLVVEKIPNQTATNLPKSIEIFPVYSASAGYILPKSDTPQVCLAAGFFVRIISGGTCTLSYQSPDTATYRASDVYLQTFEIVRTPQTLEFAPSSTVDLKSKTLTLSASASSGAAVTFTAEPAANCSVTGTTLNLLKVGNCVVTAQQAGTTTIAPISKTVTISITGKAARELRTISCVKGSKKVSVTKAKPKCPKGYSRVR
jgi:hypothetical protein